jgi:hypothetical protein
MPLLSLFFPMKAVILVGPRNLQHGKRRPPVEPDGPSEEGPEPAEIHLPERDLVAVGNVRMPLAVSQHSARGGLLSEPVEHAVHGVDIEPEHGEFRRAVSVGEADRIGESRTDLVLGNHHDVPSVLLHILDDRQISAVRFVPVTVVVAEDAAALERIISHSRRLRGERSSQAAGVRGCPLNRTASSPSATTPQDLCQNPKLTDRTACNAAPVEMPASVCLTLETGGLLQRLQSRPFAVTFGGGPTPACQSPDVTLMWRVGRLRLGNLDGQHPLTERCIDAFGVDLTWQ